MPISCLKRSASATHFLSSLIKSLHTAGSSDVPRIYLVVRIIFIVICRVNPLGASRLRTRSGRRRLTDAAYMRILNRSASEPFGTQDTYRLTDTPVYRSVVFVHYDNDFGTLEYAPLMTSRHILVGNSSRTLLCSIASCRERNIRVNDLMSSFSLARLLAIQDQRQMLLLLSPS